MSVLEDLFSNRVSDELFLAQNVRDAWTVFEGAKSRAGHGVYLGTGTSVSFEPPNRVKLFNEGWPLGHPFSRAEIVPAFYQAGQLYSNPPPTLTRPLRSRGTPEQNVSDEAFVNALIEDADRERLQDALNFMFTPFISQRPALRHVTFGTDPCQKRYVSFGSEGEHGMIDLHQSLRYIPGRDQVKGVECHGILANSADFHPRGQAGTRSNWDTIGMELGIYDMRDMD